MNTIKCDLFLITGYPNKHDCQETINVFDDFKKACTEMNVAGWIKYGGIYGNVSGWGYFCPLHSKVNQFYVEKGPRNE
jgi:hypothetical protein